ncbi:hypothetical protein [Mesorhizobium sp. CN2-181]|uniref:hypothetical protein n=1 Tax=Mesorhizobium yinganensis TaxID=3157707 RepID=UPI0032B7F024
MSEPERVDHIDVEFSPPDVGWIDITIATAAQKAELSLSQVFDPFDGEFTGWLERIVCEPRAALEFDVEGPIAIFAAEPIAASEDVVFSLMLRLHTNEEENEFECIIPRRRLVSDFYNSLVQFWESAVVAEKWLEWMYMYTDPDDIAELDERYRRPWSVRSEVVDNYLASSELGR